VAGLPPLFFSWPQPKKTSLFHAKNFRIIIMRNNKTEISVAEVRPLYSLRRLAELFDLRTRDGRPATDSVREWWHSGKLPPPDVRISRKCVYWKPETIEEYIRNGGTL